MVKVLDHDPKVPGSILTGIHKVIQSFTVCSFHIFIRRHFSFFVIITLHYSLHIVQILVVKLLPIFSHYVIHHTGTQSAAVFFAVVWHNMWIFPGIANREGLMLSRWLGEDILHKRIIPVVFIMCGRNS